MKVLAGGSVQGGSSGTVNVFGIGGSSVGNLNHGVFVDGVATIDGSGATITSTGGPVIVTGQGGGSGASAANYGVYVASGGLISAGGNGTVQVEGTGGGSGSENHGVRIEGSGAAVTSSGGDVQITGMGGNQATSMALIVTSPAPCLRPADALSR